MKPLRLQDYEIKIIKETAKKYFGENCRVLIFGSRTKLEKRGRDIDIFVETNLPISEIVRNKVKFLAELDFKIGEQKIDLVVFNSALMKKELIHEIALSEGIEI
jgi:predicted nucleotidyltransferase